MKYNKPALYDEIDGVSVEEAAPVSSTQGRFSTMMSKWLTLISNKLMLCHLVNYK